MDSYFSEQATSYSSFAEICSQRRLGLEWKGNEASRQLRALIFILILVSTQVEATVDCKPEAHLLLLVASTLSLPPARRTRVETHPRL